MTDHKANPEAVLNHMMPTPLPHGCVAMGLLTVKVVPAADVLPYPSEHMRKVPAVELPSAPGVSVQGQREHFEIQPFGSEEWKAAPKGVRVVHPIGQPLPPELCDVVIMVGTEVQDRLAPGIISAPGQRPQPKASRLTWGEVARMPLPVWQEAHLQPLKGQVA